MLTRRSVVSGFLPAKAEILPTNATGLGAAIRPIWRYSSLTSGACSPALGRTRGSGAGVGCAAGVPPVLHPIARTDPTSDMAEQIFDLIGMNRNTLPGF